MPDSEGDDAAQDQPASGTPTPSESGSALSAASRQPDDEPRSATPANGRWNKRRMAAFLRELAATLSVAAAARSVGVSRQSAYRLKNRLASTPFAFGWEVALEAGFAQLAHAMMERAVNGVEVPHYYQGELIGTSRTYDERLSIWISSNPWKGSGRACCLCLQLAVQRRIFAS